ncbi:MAG: DNA-directed RNA polymerase subunit omega [Bacteroidales bacterium]|jgi:DNA-directed RNA polymerase subunit K/omega|nr:DNA-directed RNA polymerase subunit omega [Bacteroidales bacterium]
MDYKKIRTSTDAVTRNLNDFDQETSNIYESLVILSKRANQISLELKEELLSKIEEFQTPSDSLEEIFENREQIELAKFYEQLPKPTLMAIYEFLNDKLSSSYPQEVETVEHLIQKEDNEIETENK